MRVESFRGVLERVWAMCLRFGVAWVMVCLFCLTCADAQTSPPPNYRDNLPGPSKFSLLQGVVDYTPSDIRLWGEFGVHPLQFWAPSQNPTTDIPWLFINQGGGIVTAGWVSVGGLGQGRPPWNREDWTQTMVAIEPDVAIGLGIRANPYTLPDGVTQSIPFAITAGERYQFSIANFGALQWSVKAPYSHYTSLDSTVWDTVLDRLKPGVLGVNGQALATQPAVNALAATVARLQARVAALEAKSAGAAVAPVKTQPSIQH